MIKMPRRIIFALFLLSGMTGLIYQVVWTKLLTLVFGVTILAVSTVLTSFFGGLALGSYVGGRWIDRRGNGFKWYGAAETLVGVYALVFPALIAVNNSVYVSIAHAASPGFYGQSLLKFALSVLLLIIPATLMGATLPILSKTLARSDARFAKDVGGLYAVNTAGAVIGAVLTAFILIPSIGQKTILYLAGFLNIAIGVCAILAGRAYNGDEAVSGKDAAGQGSPAHASRGCPGEANATGSAPAYQAIPGYYASLLIWGFAFSGFTGLAYEVIWTRVLGFMLIGTVYAFAAVLAVFLTGIAAGSFVFSRFADRVRSVSTLILILAAVEALIGIASIGLIGLYDKLPSFGFYRAVESTPVWSEFLFLNFLTSFITLILPTFLFGATFPLVCKLYAMRRGGTGAKIGNIYSVNTVGGIAGSFAGGFILVPFAGMQNTIVLMGLVNVAIGILFMALNPFAVKRQRYIFATASAALALTLILTLPANMPLALHKRFLTQGEDIVFYREGAAATVMIAERTGKGLAASNKRLWINGNGATAVFYEGLQINRFQGVLPMVLHQNPRDVLVICFGSGTTFGTLSTFPVDRVDNVEIASAVIEGAPHFKRENRDVLNNPRSRINIDDGRSFLAASTRKFDVITEEPMHPSLAGVVNLYTKEYYELAKAHLKEGGIMSQWIPLYNLSIEDVRLMAKTFQSVFPHTSIWLANTDIFLIGSPAKISVDYKRLREKLNLPEVKRLLTDIDLEDPAEFLNTFVMNEDMVKAYVKGADVMSDDMPIVEFTGPRSLHVNTVSPNIAELLKYREPVWPFLVFSRDEGQDAARMTLETKFASGRHNLIGRAYYADNNIPKAAEYFKESLRIDPGSRNSLHYKRKLWFF